ncbi:2OG-Fe(II) oxygenase [Hydrocarboniphaga sp.]|uniref:2OG-Fe(II) oxygenase n=1 Tax=Hydrocarboniphaga sp. TaxID=2033016 RepID=UPI003D132D93
MNNKTDVTRYIKVFDHHLEQDICDRLVSSFDESTGLHTPNGRGYRAGLEQSGWTELNLTKAATEDLRQFFRNKMNGALTRYNLDVPQRIPVPNSRSTADLILKRYRPGGADQFQLHFDSLHDVCNRYLVFLWYLNDVETGGETWFPEFDVKITARRGRLLMFPPYWMYQHAGLAPVSSDKYILSSYLLF